MRLPRAPQYRFTRRTASELTKRLNTLKSTSMPSSTVPQPITLHFQDMDHIEQLRIKFRGALVTRMTSQSGQDRVTHTDTVPLVHTDLNLWTHGGTAFRGSEAGSPVIAHPFRFQLPENLPPSFHCSGNSCRATISYSLEVVGDRPGLLRANRRIRRLISVGWTGPWKDITRDQKLRVGLWGDHSHARATVKLFFFRSSRVRFLNRALQLSLPDLPTLPITTPIPFRLDIVTETKLVRRSEHPVDKAGKPLFPAPPVRSAQFTQVLRRGTEVRVRGQMRERVAQAAEAVIDEPDSTLSLLLAPTFSSVSLGWLYVLQFVVPFPGIGNDLKLQFPIRLGPGSPCPPPPNGAPGSSSTSYADVLPVGPPPMQDLPPAYWAGDDHDWDDEKK
ncbi:hypothetical protein FB451DRAFT_1563751 [Mycena latifolia]|nr:hypothetical protein FB451DRAFT_1563751 [Mycena latifolia]